MLETRLLCDECGKVIATKANDGTWHTSAAHLRAISGIDVHGFTAVKGSKTKAIRRSTVEIVFCSGNCLVRYMDKIADLGDEYILEETKKQLADRSAPVEIPLPV